MVKGHLESLGHDLSQQRLGVGPEPVGRGAVDTRLGCDPGGGDRTWSVGCEQADRGTQHRLTAAGPPGVLGGVLHPTHGAPSVSGQDSATT